MCVVPRFLELPFVAIVHTEKRRGMGLEEHA